MNALPLDNGIRSIASVAKLAGRPRNSMTRLLLALHARDREADLKPDWLLVVGPRKFKINMARLQRMHPALFTVRYVTADEHDDLVGRVDELETSHAAFKSETRIRVNAVAAKVREVAARRSA